MMIILSNQEDDSVLNFDVIIIGGGMVGLATACALSESHLRIALIEPNLNQNIELPDTATLRASAINAASQRYLQQIGIWESLQQSNRVLNFNQISVWEKQGFAKLSADSKDYHYDNLGYIIENKLIQNTLYKKAQQSKNITFFHQRCQHLQFDNATARVELDNLAILSCKLVIGADGANSWVRQQIDIPVIQKPYRHHALIATVETELPHQACARQLFYPQGIVAFLPLWHPNQSCLVWSVKPDMAKELNSISSDEFEHTLSNLTEHKLGHCKLLSQRATFPLIARYCRSFVKHRLALIGDAAHTIHPLAGQGVNLGFQDSYLLVKTIKKLHHSDQDIGLANHLRPFQSARQKDTLVMLGAMQTIQNMFDGNSVFKKIVRGVGMNIVDRVPFIKKNVLKHAMGL